MLKLFCNPVFKFKPFIFTMILININIGCLIGLVPLAKADKVIEFLMGEYYNRSKEYGIMVSDDLDMYVF